MPSLIDIDPASITKDNIPSVLGAIVIELKSINKRLDDGLEQDKKTAETIDTRLKTVEQTLQDHDKYFWGPIRISKCHIIPFLKNNKYAMAMLFTAMTFWISAIDYLVRAIQWALQPPIKLN